MASRRARAADMPPFPPPDPLLPGSAEWDFVQPRPARLDLWGRITDMGTPVRETAGRSTPVVEWLPRDRVLPLLEVVHAEGSNPRNDVWYRVANGYLYTASVQQMRPYRMPFEVEEITTTVDERPGFWAEVIVPYTIARGAPGGGIRLLEDNSQMVLYYASVHHVIGVELDEAGFRWYKVRDDKKGARPYYVLARHVRRISPQDFAPISQGADKRIVVTLDEQRIDCYEGETVVFSTLTSSGGGGYGTPRGEWAVVYKQPARHMYSDPELEAFSDPDYFDLPGVPFNIFFTTMGHAIHGTYWHGDYGRPRSHGCLNVTPEAARWMYRWTDPPAGYDQIAVGSSRDPGTPVVVV